VLTGPFAIIKVSMGFFVALLAFEVLLYPKDTLTIRSYILFNI
jgi:hypothetical protein